MTRNGRFVYEVINDDDVLDAVFHDGESIELRAHKEKPLLPVQ